jgi:murein L,D-transpeptidase YcbB/YkuD
LGCSAKQAGAAAWVYITARSGGDGGVVQFREDICGKDGLPEVQAATAN